MADRTDFFFRQKVTEAELDLAFELLERAQRNLAADIGVWGIVTGAEAAQHDPLPDLTVDLSSPARAYDLAGQRVYFGTDQNVDCAIDLNGLPTEVSSSGNERWLGIFLVFERQLSDPRTDGNSQQIFFRRDESFRIVVRQGPEGPSGSASKVSLEQDELLVCDVLRRPGQTQILNADIDTSRRQAFIFANADSLSVLSGLWSTLNPVPATVQRSLDLVDEELTKHFGATGRRHSAQDVDYTPHGFIEAKELKSAVDEMVDKLSSTESGSPGASIVGADSIPGTPNALSQGSVDGQLSAILGWLNEHLEATSGAHHASAISATTHGVISSTSVQAQLQQIISLLASHNNNEGTSLIGNRAIAGTPREFVDGTLRQHLAQLLDWLNDHLGSGDHDSRYYNVGTQVDDADTLDGKHASAFALAGHDHDSRYMRQTYIHNHLITAGQTHIFTTLSEPPDLITTVYAYDDGSGSPEATSYINGQHSPNVRTWVTKVDMGGGDKDYRISVRNSTTVDLHIKVTAFTKE